MASLMSLVFWSILVMPAMAGMAGIFKNSNSKDLLREAFSQNNWPLVASHSQKLAEGETTDNQKDIYRLVQAIGLQRQEKWQESIKILEPINEQSPYYTWAKVFLTRLAYSSGNVELLKSTLQALEKINLKGDLKIEKRFYEAHLHIVNKNWNQAAKILKQIEKPSRGGELNISILENMALADSNSSKPTVVCKNLLKLYSKYPTHPWFAKVAPEIKNIELGDKKISCAVSAKDFEARRRTLNLIGEFKMANEELQKWFTLAAIPPKQQQILQSQQVISEGHPEEAVQILKAIPDGANDLQILIPLSFAVARAGDLKAATELSLKVHSLLGFSKQGNMALYQAAAWSYQTRDYDNAEERFKKVRVNRLSRAYQKEVQWYLGWIRYLKGDYVAAEKSFRNLQKTSGRRSVKESQDRIQYWLAMALLKQDKQEKARVLFRKLESKKGMNYYSFLARERLKQIPDKKRVPAKEETPIQLAVNGRSGIYITPFGEEAPWPSDSESESTEEEISSSDSDESTLLAEETGTTDVSEEDKSSEDSENAAIELFSQSEANQKLERAKAFWSVGLEDLARSEVGDLERYSRNFDLFKKITDEYRQMGLYNKMSVLGQSYVGKANLSSSKYIFEAIYPRAYAEQVEKYSAEHNVAQALVWGIMKAESMYRPWVKSPVGALGLMQVMPVTGQKLAEMLEVKSFSPQVLLQPQEAIRFGSKYLERLGKKFDHCVQLVAAAYNAGPHRVSQWLYYFGYMPMDEWVEHIPFIETRNYVKKVTSNYMAYKELYGKGLGESLALIDPVPVQIAGAPETKENWE